jgi:hypothetical protein
VAVPGAYVELTPLATCPGVCCPVAGMERPSVPIIVADLSLAKGAAATSVQYGQH